MPKILLSILLLALLVGCATAAAEQVQFVAVNDTPYTKKELKRFTGKTPAAIAAAKVPFVVVLGDIKSGKEACTDALLLERRDQVAALHPEGAVFYTPGDNEWTDCDRGRFGDEARSELEALDFLRGAFFAAPYARAGDPIYARQPGFPENVRWKEGGVLFVALHVVGTNNGRVQIKQDEVGAVLAQVDAREAAVRTWLDEAAALAKQADALVILQHGDPTQPAATAPCTPDNRQECDPYAPHRARLAEVATELGKPTLLVHGDTNPFCMDTGFGGAHAPSLWRLNAWGDFQEPGDATLVTVQPEGETPFAARTLLEGKPAEACP